MDPRYYAFGVGRRQVTVIIMIMSLRAFPFLVSNIGPSKIGYALVWLSAKALYKQRS